MQLDRISYQYPDGTTAAYDFHPRLTVIDVHPSHRSALVEHLLSALSSEAPGVHVEFTRADKAFVAFRPYGGAHRVVSLEGAGDATGPYRKGESVDVLAPLGLDRERAAATLLAGHADLTLVDPTEGWMARLLDHDTGRLLAAAQDAVAAERALREATAAARSTPEQASVVTTVYRQRDTATDLEKRHNQVRLATLIIGTGCPVAAVLGFNTFGTGPALGLIGVAAAVAGGCLVYERKLAKAVDAEYEALAGAGAASYSELEHRLDGSPLADAAQRNQLVEAAERYRTATAAWQDLAGDIPAPWVVAQQDRLVELAGMRAALQAAPTAGADREQSASAALLAGLMSRAGAIKEVGGGEPLPLFLDDPLAGLQWADKVPVLEFINRLAERQQLVLCTDDLEILQWAKLEAMAGNAEVVDVNPGRAMAAGAGAEPAPSGATGPAAPRTAGGQAS
ncbi:MAG: hypothetical protein AB7W59_05935 [Acidimicrobiia bacterium]